MLPIHVALVSEQSAITLSELGEVAAALQKQVTRDFGPIWGVTADVSAFGALESLPLDYWPIIIKDDIGTTALGYHTDNGQPFSLVKYTQTWTLTASHELLEMLGDPFGNRLVAGQSPIAAQGRVQFLVEVCDPCEGDRFAYSVNGVTVSDFYTPHYFDPTPAQGVRYSYNNSLSVPRQVREGGYLSWLYPETGEWWQRTWFDDGAGPQDRNLGKLSARHGSLRSAIDRITAENRQAVMNKSRSLMEAKAAGAAAGEAPSFKARSQALREAIRRVMG